MPPRLRTEHPITTYYHYHYLLTSFKTDPLYNGTAETEDTDDLLPFLALEQYTGKTVKTLAASIKCTLVRRKVSLGLSVLKKWPPETIEPKFEDKRCAPLKGRHSKENFQSAESEACRSGFEGASLPFGV